MKSIKGIQFLLSSTSDRWVQQAIAHPFEVLLDHAHCERKAAGYAVQLIFRYMSEPGLPEVLSPLAREELEHFERVLDLLHSKGYSLERLPSPPYAGELMKHISNQEPERMLDSFLVAGIIEARSHERMKLLSLHSNDIELRELYKDLLRSEARHCSLYWDLAADRFDIKLIKNRLNKLSQVEARILSNLYPKPRMHS